MPRVQPRHGGFHIRLFNFSHRGRSSLPLRGGAGRSRKTLLLEDGAYVMLGSNDKRNSWGGLRPLRDGSLFHLVSCLSQSAGSETVR